MKLPFENDKSHTLRGRLAQWWLILVWIVVPVVAVLKWISKLATNLLSFLPNF